MSAQRKSSHRFTPRVLEEVLARVAEKPTPLTLHVSDGFSERIVYFTDGGVQVVSLGERSGPDLATALVSNRLTTKEALASIASKSQVSRKGLAELIVQNGLLSHEELENCCRRIVTDELFDLAFWSEAIHLVTEVPPPGDFFKPERAPVIAVLSYPQLHEDVAGWIKHWSIHKLTLHGDQTRLSLKDAGREAASSASGNAAKILAALAEPKSIRELWRGLHIELPELCEQLSHFVERKWVAAGTFHKNPATAGLEASIATLEANLKRMIGKDLVREKLAELYVRAKQPDKACEQYQALADETAGRGDWKAAAESLSALVMLKPDNIAALSQAVGILRQHGQDEEARTVTFQVAQALFTQKKAAELKLVASILETIPDATVFAPEVRGDLSSLAGQTEKAAAEYLAALARYEEWGLSERANGAAAKAAACGVAAEVIQKRVQHLKERGAPPNARSQTGTERSKRRAGKLSLRLVAALLIAAATGGGLFWSGLIPGTARTAGAGPAESAKDKKGAGSKSPGQQTAAAPAAAVKVQLPAGAGLTAGAGGRGASTVKPGGNLDPRSAFVIAENGGAAGAGGAGGDGSPPGAEIQPPAAETKDPLPAGTQDPASEASSPAAAPEPREPAGTEAVAQPGETADPSSSASPDDIKALEPFDDADLLAAVPPALPAVTQLCEEHERHVVARRSLRDCRVRFADACALSAEAVETGERIVHLPGRPGWRWAVSWHGDVACHWIGGESPVVYGGLGTGKPERVVVLWQLPDEPEAVAVGEDAIAFRQGRTTVVRAFGGAILGEREVLSWTEGVLAGKSLIVADAHEPGGGPRPLTVLDRELLRVVRVIRAPAER